MSWPFWFGSSCKHRIIVYDSVSSTSAQENKNMGNAIISVAGTPLTKSFLMFGLLKWTFQFFLVNMVS